MPRPLSALLFALLAAPAPLALGAPPQRIAFPKDAHVLDAKRDLGAKGDGVADDTDALQKGIDLSSGFNQKVTKALYLPDGVYRVTKSLVVRNALGPWLYGESMTGTIIRLDGGAQGVTAVLRTHPNEVGPTSADWFMRNLRNFTVDVGNNPTCDGVRYHATNSGIVQNVRVVGNGVGGVGINAGFLDKSGPNLIQDCEIDGFEAGILSQWIWGETISRVRVTNCRKAGLVVSANVVAAEGLVVENTPLAVDIQEPSGWGHWAGVAALVNCKFAGGDPKGPAIRNRGVLACRNVETAGFARALDGADGANLTEFASHPVKSLFDAPKAGLPMAVKPEPLVPWELDASKWVCANDFGAVAGDNRDDTAALQEAIDAAAAAGRTTVYLRGCGGGDPNWYTLDGEVRIHGSVRHILGLGWARVLGGKAGRLVVTDDSAPAVKVQNIDAFGGPPITVENRSAKSTLVVESCGVTILGTGAGDIFATDCPFKLELAKPGEKAWCRQLNPEGDSDDGLVKNAGGELWVLGMKCEGRGVRARTSAGGKTAIHGALIYGPGNEEKDRRPLFAVAGGSLEVLGLREINFGGHTYTVKVAESRAGVARELDKTNEGGWIGWALYRGYAGPATGPK